MLGAMLRPIFAHVLEQNTVWDLSVATLVLAGTVGLLRLLQVLIVRRLSRTSPHTDTILDDMILDGTRRTSSLFQLAVGIALAASLIDFPEPFNTRVHTGVLLVCILQAGLWGTGLVQYLIVGLLDRRAEPGDVAHRTGKNMLRFVGLSAVWSLVTLLILENLGVHVSTLMAGVGVTGVAVAFALQNILGDLLSSIAILLDKPFLVGDYVVCETFSGTIEKIGIRTTRLRALTGEAVVLANFDLARARLRNYKSLRERRQTFNFSLRYDTPPDALAQVPSFLRDIIKILPNARFDRAHLLSLTELGLQYEVVYYSTVPDYVVFCDIQNAIVLGMLRRFAEHNIQFAYRTQVNYPGGA
jgi:small-conductance mechanosensitive channel